MKKNGVGNLAAMLDDVADILYERIDDLQYEQRSSDKLKGMPLSTEFAVDHDMLMELIEQLLRVAQVRVAISEIRRHEDYDEDAEEDARTSVPVEVFISKVRKPGEPTRTCGCDGATVRVDVEGPHKLVDEEDYTDLDEVEDAESDECECECKECGGITEETAVKDVADALYERMMNLIGKRVLTEDEVKALDELRVEWIKVIENNKKTSIFRDEHKGE